MWIELRSTFFVALIGDLLVHDLCDLRMVSLDEHSLSVFFDLKDIVEHALVEGLETICVLGALDLGSKVDLSNH